MNIFWMPILQFPSLILVSVGCCTLAQYCELSVHMLHIINSNHVQDRLQQFREQHELGVVHSLVSPLLSRLVMAVPG